MVSFLQEPISKSSIRISSLRYVPLPSPPHLILVDLTAIFSEILQIKKLHIVQFFHPHLSSSLVRQNIFLSALFSITFIPSSPLTFRAKFDTRKSQKAN